MLSREMNMTRRKRHVARPREVLVIVQPPGSRAVAVKEAVIAEAAALAPIEAAARTRNLVLDPIMVLAMVLAIPALVRTQAVGREDLALAKVATRLIGVVAQARVKARTVVKDLDPALAAFRPSKVEAQGGGRVRTDLVRTCPWSARWYNRILERPLMEPPKPTHVYPGVRRVRARMEAAVANGTLRSVRTSHLPGNASFRTSATSFTFVILAKAEGEKARPMSM
jgi:hypothetical protein